MTSSDDIAGLAIVTPQDRGTERREFREFRKFRAIGPGVQLVSWGALRKPDRFDPGKRNSNGEYKARGKKTETRRVLVFSL